MFRMNIWTTVYKLRCAHFNKKLCRQAADIIENLANDLDYRMELHKDASAECKAILADVVRLQDELADATKYIRDHF